MGRPQPASLLLGHEGITLPELTGMLGLNSLMFVKHLVKGPGLQRGGCTVKSCNARRDVRGLMDQLLKRS